MFDLARGRSARRRGEDGGGWLGDRVPGDPRDAAHRLSWRSATSWEVGSQRRDSDCQLLTSNTAALLERIQHRFGLLRCRRVVEVNERLVVDRLFLRGYLAWLMSMGIRRSSVTRKLSAVRSFFRFLRQAGVIEVDRTSLVNGPRRESRLPAIASSFEIDRLLDGPDVATDAGIRDRALLEVLYAAGLRVSEPLAARGVADATSETGGREGHAQWRTEDDRTAGKWCTPAAEQGNAAAQYNLGWM